MLKKLCLEKLPLPWLSPALPLLERLELDHVYPTRRQWVSLLRGSPRLQQIELYDSGPQLDDDHPTHAGTLTEDAVQLPELSLLTLYELSWPAVAYLLGTIHAPALDQLDLSDSGAEDRVNESRAIDILERVHYPKLRTLDLSNTRWDEAVFLKLLNRLPSVETLIFYRWDGYLEILIKHHASLTAGGRPVLPKLRTLRAAYCSADLLRRFSDERERLGYGVPEVSSSWAYLSDDE